MRRLAVPFGGLSDKMLACAFVAGLPDTVKQLLRAGSRMEELPIDQILMRARAVLADDVGVAAAVSAMTGAGTSVKRANSTLLCYQCNQPNHLARDCLLRQKGRVVHMVGVDEVLDEAMLGVTNVMVWVTLRRRVRETRTGGGRLR